MICFISKGSRSSLRYHDNQSKWLSTYLINIKHMNVGIYMYNKEKQKTASKKYQHVLQGMFCRQVVSSVTRTEQCIGKIMKTSS